MEDVSYATVQFRSQGAAPRAVKREEDVVYDEVMERKKTASAAAAAAPAPGADKEPKAARCQPAARCLGALCAALVLGLVAACVYFGRRLTTKTDDIHNLTALNQNLTTDKQQLEAQSNNLTQLLQTTVAKWKQLNVSRAQWAIDSYCPKQATGRYCKTCQDGWLNLTSSCYAVNNAASNERRTWEGAGDDCREKNSDLAVVGNQEEKTFVSDKSWTQSDITGYWIGLRAEGGRWRWINGSFLADSSWVDSPATNNSCVTSLQGRGWKSVKCDETHAWLCKKQGLSV